MATIYALEGDRDWSSSGSFNTAIDGSGSAGLPVSGDTLIVFGETNVTAGHTALAAVNLAYCYVRGNLSATSTLSFDVSSGTTGELHIQNVTGELRILASATDGLDKVVFAPRSGGASLSLESGTFPIVVQKGGLVTKQSAAVVTSWYKSGGTALAYDGSTAITTFVNSGSGLVDTRVNITTLHNNGEVTVSGDAATATINNWGNINDRSSVAPTTLNQYAGSWSPAGSPISRTITTANWFGGRIVSRVLGSDLLVITTNNNHVGGSLESVDAVPPFVPFGGF